MSTSNGDPTSGQGDDPRGAGGRPAVDPNLGQPAPLPPGGGAAGPMSSGGAPMQGPPRYGPYGGGPYGPPPGGGYYGPPPYPPRRGRALAIIGWVLAGLLLIGLALSMFGNLVLLATLGQSAGGGKVVEEEYQAGNADHRLVILPVNGVIEDQAAQFIREALAHLRNHRPRAIVLRVNSPGGTITASDRIWRDLTAFRKETGIPIVASYGSMATSGGYYVSAFADHILAEPTTITGSIGVIAGGMVFKELLDKIGVEPKIRHSDRADKKDLLSGFREWEEKDEQFIRDFLNHAHARFVTVVLEGRQKVLDRATFEALKLDSGQPFDADYAREHKLIDDLGYLDDALAEAARRGGIPTGAKPRVTTVGRPTSLIEALLGVQARSGPALGLDDLTGDQVRRLLAEVSAPRIEYRWSPSGF